MIFSIQRYLEDHFNQRGLRDIDQYAVTLAALYDRERYGRTSEQFLSMMKRMRTAFYRRNAQIARPLFEKKLLVLLDSKFKKKDCSPQKESMKRLRLQASV